MSSNFYVYSNSLEGSLPSQIGNMVNMSSYFYLRYNSFSGSLPSEIGNMVNMGSYFSLQSNAFSGSIPTEIGAAGFQRLIYLDTNLLTGSLPTELGALDLVTSEHLYFFLKSNSLCGAVPSEVEALSTSNSYAQYSSSWDISSGNSLGTTCGRFDEWPKLPTTMPSRCALPALVRRPGTPRPLRKHLIEERARTCPHAPAPPRLNHPPRSSWPHLYPSKQRNDGSRGHER